MPNTLLRNPVQISALSTSQSLSVGGTAAASTTGGGSQPAATLSVQGTAGQETTGTGQTAGTGAPVSLVGGTGGAAPSGSANGTGGSVTINPGAPGAGAGTAARYGNVLLASDGGNVAVGTTTADISAIGTSVTTLTVFKNSGRGNLELATNNDSDGAAMGTVTFTNSLQSTSTKRAAEIRGLAEGATATNRGGRLTFGTRSSGGSDVTTRMIIDQAGNLSLGNFTPACDLDISKTESGGRTEVRLNNLSNTASSRAFFDLRVAGTSAGSPVLNFGVVGAVSWAAGIDNADSQKFKINWSNSTSTNDNFAGTNVVTLLGTSGNMGLGTTTPTSKLHVNGGVQIGSPTGGDKGSGSINVSGDIYKNGVAQLQKIDALTKRLARLELLLSRKSPKPPKPAKAKKAAKPKQTVKSKKTRKERR